MRLASWDVLHGWYTAKRINHSLAFSDDGACTNQAELFFSRLRRMVGGQHHKVSGQYLHQYAAHAAWLGSSAGRQRRTCASSAWPIAQPSCVSPVEGLLAAERFTVLNIEGLPRRGSPPKLLYR